MNRVRLTSLLSRVPSIKFKKGGIANVGGPAVSGATGGSQQVGGAANSQPTATMSTIPDSALPARYRRTPLSEEEIAAVNGGGIKEKVSKSKSPNKQADLQMLGSLKIPKGILIKSPGGKGQVVSLNVTLQRGTGGK